MEIITTGKKRYSEMESLLIQTRKLLRRSGLRARKRLAQYFLTDEEVLGLIVSTARLSVEDVVIEVGSGIGTLTEELAKRAARVIAIELDDKLASVLEQRLVSFQNVTVVNIDVLKVEPKALLTGTKTGYKVVANLPYYITSPVLRHFLETEVKPQSMVVMVQKEVAEEIVAKPGKMSLLSIGMQIYGQPEIVSIVPAGSFYPEPAVDSAILRVIPYSQPVVEAGDAEGFFTLVRAGFSAARKQLANSLAQGLGIPKDEVFALLEKTQIGPQRRAETLTLEDWARLWEMYGREK